MEILEFIYYRLHNLATVIVGFIFIVGYVRGVAYSSRNSHPDDQDQYVDQYHNVNGDYYYSLSAKVSRGEDPY